MVPTRIDGLAAMWPVLWAGLNAKFASSLSEGGAAGRRPHHRQLLAGDEQDCGVALDAAAPGLLR